MLLPRFHVRFKGPVLESLFGGLHWVLRDGRRGVVLEFVQGALKVYEDVGILGLCHAMGTSL